jgi:hypothetical protein
MGCLLLRFLSVVIIAEYGKDNIAETFRKFYV